MSNYVERVIEEKLSEDEGKRDACIEAARELDNSLDSPRSRYQNLKDKLPNSNSLDAIKSAIKKGITD